MTDVRADNGFNFEDWFAKANDGLKYLRQRRVTLIEECDKAQSALERCDGDIAALEAMLEAHIGAVPQYDSDPTDKPKRVHGVTKTLRELATEMVNGVEWTEDQLVRLVQKELPGAKEKSIRNACKELTREGLFIQEGKRNAWRYTTTVGQEAQEAPENVQEPETPEVDAIANAPEEPAQDPEQQSLHEVVVMNEMDVIAAITKEMKKRKSIAMAEKNIGWVATDLRVEPKLVRDALKIMVQGEWELAYEGDQKVLRRKAEPGSRDELKRTHVKDQPLFPDADRPSHA